MEDIRWQDPYKRKFFGERRHEEREKGRRLQSTSFADRFLGPSERNLQPDTPAGNNQMGGQPHYRAQEHRQQAPAPNPENPYPFHQPYYGSTQAQQGYPPPHGQYTENQPPQPQFQAGPPPIPAGNGYQTQWQFLDLKNRKQTGDLYKSIISAGRKNQAKTFCFTSGQAREGVTTVLCNLLNYIKNQGNTKRILVIDANIANPGMSHALNLPNNSYGLKDVLSNRVALQSALMPVGPNIWALGCGNRQQQDMGNFEPEEFSKIITQCQQFADYIFIDCPPVLSSPDALAVAPSADLSFLIVQAVKVRRQVAEKSLSILQNNECELGGVILNRVEQVIPSWLYRYI